MICLSCKQQIPDDSERCPNCGAEVFPKNQLVKEIGFRRYQRWIFYCLFFLAFAAAVGIGVRIYNMNSQLLLSLADTKSTLSQKQSALDLAQANLAALQETANELQAQNKSASSSLSEEIAAAQTAVDQATALQSQAGQDKSQLDFYNSLEQDAAKVASPITAADLSRIPFADAVYGGTDTDGDGLPDILEADLGTSATSTDTDGDGYSDRAELISGFDPLVKNGKLPIDQTFAAAQKGKIFLDPSGYLWYVGTNAERYFLGKGE
jgi:Bacterial TSP3 repeat